MEKIGKKVGLTGPLAAGKGEVAKYLIKRNFFYISLSDIVRETLRKKNIKETRENLIKTGNNLRNRGGAGILGKKVREKIESNEKTRNWVIDGIRNPSEINELKKMNNFYLIAVVAPQKTLIKRVISRKRNSDPISEQTIKKKLKKDWGIGQPEDGQQVGKCIMESDYFLLNDGSLKKLYSDIKNILNRMF